MSATQFWLILYYVVGYSVYAFLFSPNVYILYQLGSSLRHHRRHFQWSRYWFASWPVMLVGAITAFQGGGLLMLAAVGLWFYAAVRCWQEKQATGTTP